jgi:hypothetical protein
MLSEVTERKLHLVSGNYILLLQYKTRTSLCPRFYNFINILTILPDISYYNTPPVDYFI